MVSGIESHNQTRSLDFSMIVSISHSHSWEKAGISVTLQNWSFLPAQLAVSSRLCYEDLRSPLVAWRTLLIPTNRTVTGFLLFNSKTLMTFASLLQSSPSSLWSPASLTLGWMICVPFSCCVIAARTKKHQRKRSLQVETRTSFSWHLSSTSLLNSKVGAKTPSALLENTCVLQIHANSIKFPMFYARYQHLATNP